MRVRAVLPAFVALALAACASLPREEPLQVTVSGVEPLPGEGFELRMLLKLRVQNPGDSPVVYDGVAVTLDVQGKTFATGVSDAEGSIPRFGEVVVEVPVTVSAMRMARQVMGAMDGEPVGKIRYDMSGKLHGPGLGGRRFQSQGELALPGSSGAARGP